MIIYEAIRKFIIREDVIAEEGPAEDKPSQGGQPKTEGASLTTDSSEDEAVRRRHIAQNSVQHRLDRVEAAYNDQITYVVGKEQMRIREGPHAKDWIRRITLAAFLWLRGNTGSKVANLNVDVDKLVEIGFVKMV